VVGLLTLLVGGLAFETGRRWPIERLQALWPRAHAPQAATPWTTFAPMVFPRYEPGAILVGRRLFVLGGFRNRDIETTDRVDILRLDDGAWESGSPMPLPLTHFNPVLRGDTLWIAGGFVGDHPGPPTTAVWQYLIAEDRWLEGPSLPAARGSGVLVARGDTLHYLGGWAEDRNIDRAEHWMLRPGDTRWHARAPLPEPRGHATAVYAEGAIWVFGGNQGHDPVPLDVAHVHRYDPIADTWDASPPLPYAVSHQEPATAMWRGLVVLAGGRSRPTAQENVDAILGYDPMTGRTVPLGRLPQPRLGTVAVMLGDTIYTGFGGEFGNHPTTDSLAKTVLTGVWHRAEDLPVALGEVAAAVVGDRLFVMGSGSKHTLAWNLRSGRWDPVGTWSARPNPGDHQSAEVWDDQLVLVGGFGWESEGQVQVFDPSGNRWRTGPPLPTRVGSVATAVINGRLYAAGGIAHDTTTGAAWVLDSLGGNWRAIAPMPRPRNHAAAGTDGERFYLFGGRGPGSGTNNVVANGYDDVQIYDPRTDTWTISDGSPGAPLPLPQARGGMGKAVWLDGAFWVIGGETDDGPGATSAGTYARVDIYEPVTNRWRPGPPLGVARHGHFPVVAEGRLLVPGGGTVAAASRSSVLEMLFPR
jgi:N-acetylneuraminic acid mutarotase